MYDVVRANVLCVRAVAGSPLTTAPNQTAAWSAMDTSPTRVALGATHDVVAVRGLCSPTVRTLPATKPAGGWWQVDGVEEEGRAA